MDEKKRASTTSDGSQFPKTAENTSQAIRCTYVDHWSREHDRSCHLVSLSSSPSHQARRNHIWIAHKCLCSLSCCFGCLSFSLSGSSESTSQLCDDDRGVTDKFPLLENRPSWGFSSYLRTRKAMKSESSWALKAIHLGNAFAGF